MATTRPAAAGDGVHAFARNRRVSVGYLTASGRQIPTVEPLDDLQVEGGARR